MAVDAIYTATAHFDHPLLPLVLDYGSTEVAGRSFIAYQTSEPVAGGGHRTRRGTMTALAELQIAALECGFAGIHLPLHELKRLREGARLEARHLPVNEFLCEPHRGDGASGLAGLEAEEEGAPFPSPGDPRRVAGVFAPRGARLPAGRADPRASRGPRRRRRAARRGRQDRRPVGPSVPASTVCRDRRAEGAGPARPVAAPRRPPGPGALPDASTFRPRNRHETIGADPPFAAPVDGNLPSRLSSCESGP